MRAVITGATNGIGAAVAERLAREGMDVTLVGRSHSRLAATTAHLRRVAPDARVAAEQADLGNLEEVRALTARLAAAPAFDVVVSNAALVAPLDDRDALGVPKTVAVNYLAPYVLLRGLAESLWDRRARFVIVGADPGHLARARVDVDDLHFAHTERLGDDPELQPFALYAHTKNMDAMLMLALARRLRDTAITVTGAHPGIIGQTGLTDAVPGLRQRITAGYGLDTETLPSPDTGADTPAWLAGSADLDGVTGAFFVERKAVPLADHVSEEARCDALWVRTAQLVGMAEHLTSRPRTEP